MEGHAFEKKYIIRYTVQKIGASRTLLNWWILPIGGASAVKGQGLQPAQQACFGLLPFFCLGLGIEFWPEDKLGSVRYHGTSCI